MSFRLGRVVSGNSMIIHIRADFSANFWIILELRNTNV